MRIERLSEHALVSCDVAGDIVDEVRPTGVRKTKCTGLPAGPRCTVVSCEMSDRSKEWQEQHG